ncbi:MULTISPECIES: glycosyltransferase family 4 protein [unclassified Pyramidobacter]|uniref:glycosyltransferase family 4 protein n=1 Tax=unclassified Pyramidobacter TaxID=2632171 RepID=UPI000EA1A5B7|nr:glycosyltransferase family 4 protein [Pyramidobacter sp. CG50-2]RKJ77983.1 glycosyltransferase family 1 protein [Pyramidobacter sp. CG50-2]
MKKLLIATTIQRTLRDFLLPYGDYFRAQGWQVDAMANARDPFPAAESHFDRFYAVDWGRRPLDPHNFARAPRAVRELVAREKYDIVHVHTPVAAFVARFALRGLRAARQVKVVYTAHGFHFFKGNSKIKNGLFIALEKLAGRWTDRLVVINREDYDAAQKHRIVPRENVALMPGIGVDLSRYSRGAVSDAQVAAAREEMRLTPEDRYILMIAEFNPGKRHRDAVRALARIEEPRLHLAFAGQGPLFAETQALARRCGVEKRCHFLGQRDDVPALLKGAAAAVLPSEREGLPRSILEAMAMGTPAIGADVRGTRDLLAGGCGTLVPVGDTEALAHAFHAVFGAPAPCREHVRRASEKVKNYAIERLQKMHEQLYAGLLSPAPAPRQKKR